MSSTVLGVSHFALYLHMFGTAMPLFSLDPADTFYGATY